MGRLTTYISLSLAVSQAYAGCQPQIAFAPPKLTADSLKGTFDHIKSTIDGLAKRGVFKTSSFSLQIASSTEDLFSLSHAADTPFIRGTKNVDKSSVYRVASNSKLFTALAILRLEAAGKLSLDHSVTTHVPGLQNSPTIDWSKITIRSLLSHLSGIPDSCGCFLWQEKLTSAVAQEDLLFELADPSIYGLPAFPANTTSDYPKCENFSNNTKTCTEQGRWPILPCNANIAELVAYLAKTPTVFAPRVEPSYSNNGFALLGQVVANVAGQSYEEHIASTIFKPLNMTKSSFTAPNESSAVIPEHSYFGMDLGVGNP
jgi:CubicO group peptidase (beta-lactamase class C family)